MPPSRNRQVAIIQKLKEYFKTVGRDSYFDLDFGLCSGLVEYKLFSTRLGFDDEFERDISYILNWDVKQFKSDGLASDSVIDDFLNTIVFLQADSLLREGVKGDELKRSVDLLLGSTPNKIADPEFRITFVFTPELLLELLTQIAKSGKMIRICTNDHVIGISCVDGRFLLHDFSSESSDIPCRSVLDLTRNIFRIFTPWEKSAKQLALHITVADVVEAVSRDYSDPLVLIQNWMRNPEIARMVLKNENIFHLASRYADFKFMDFLFANGYVYKPWIKTEDSELIETIMNRDLKTLTYLVKKGIPINARRKGGVTALGKAIMLKSSKMLYKLLEAGADPNIEPVEKISAIDVALLPKYKNRDNMILLLAFGARITSTQLQQMHARFGEDADYIVKHAISFNAKFLKVPEHLDLSKARGRDVVAFLHHAKTCLMLEARVSASDQGTIQAIKDFYKTKASDAKWSFAEKAEIHKMLKLFAFDEAAALIQQLNVVAAEITKLKFAQLRSEDFVRISGILDELTELAAYTGTSFSKLHVSHLAASAKRTIEAYLRRNGVSNLAVYLRDRHASKPSRTTAAYFAISHGGVVAMDADYESVIIPELLRNLEAG